MAYTFSTPIPNPCLEGHTETLRQGIHYVSHSEIPIAWFSEPNLRLNDDPVVLPNDPNGTILKLRAKDMMEFSRRIPKSQKGKTPWPTSLGQGSLLFDGEKLSRLYGGPNERIEDGRLFFSIQSDTQLPSLNFRWRIKGRDERLLTYRFVVHGNAGIQDVTYHSPDSIRAGDLGDLVPLKHSTAAAEGRLLAINIHFGRSSPLDRWNNCVSLMNDAEAPGIVDRWSNTRQMINSITLQEFISTFDHAISDMFEKQNMRMIFFREIAPSDGDDCKQQFDEAYENWVQLMRLSIEHGPFWWFHLQPRMALYPCNRLEYFPPVPFWLVSRFRVRVTNAGLTELLPVTWASILQDPRSHEEWRLPRQSIETRDILHYLAADEKRFQESNARDNW